MTRIAKLYEQLLTNRKRLTFAEYIRLVEAFGFRHYRTQGSHQIYIRDGIPEQINAQPKGKDAKYYQVRQFLSIIEKYNLTLDSDG
jgi:predicted RNA binding protein YcfA (HicA-like mRNA interferase family)